MSSRLNRLVNLRSAVVMSLVAVAMMVVSLASWSEYTGVRDNGATATAVIESQRPTYGRWGRRSGTEVVVSFVANGAAATAKVQAPSDFQAPIGSKLPIVYDRSKPTRAFVSAPGLDTTVVTGILAVLFSVGAVLIWRAYLRRRRAGADGQPLPAGQGTAGPGGMAPGPSPFGPPSTTGQFTPPTGQPVEQPTAFQPTVGTAEPLPVRGRHPADQQPQPTQVFPSVEPVAGYPQPGYEPAAQPEYQQAGGYPYPEQPGYPLPNQAEQRGYPARPEQPAYLTDQPEPVGYPPAPQSEQSMYPAAAQPEAPAYPPAPRSGQQPVHPAAAQPGYPENSGYGQPAPAEPFWLEQPAQPQPPAQPAPADWHPGEAFPPVEPVAGYPQPGYGQTGLPEYQQASSYPHPEPAPSHPATPHLGQSGYPADLRFEQPAPSEHPAYPGTPQAEHPAYPATAHLGQPEQRGSLTDQPQPVGYPATPQSEPVGYPAAHLGQPGYPTQTHPEQPVHPAAAQPGYLENADYGQPAPGWEVQPPLEQAGYPPLAADPYPSTSAPVEFPAPLDTPLAPAFPPPAPGSVPGHRTAGPEPVLPGPRVPLENDSVGGAPVPPAQPAWSATPQWSPPAEQYGSTAVQPEPVSTGQPVTPTATEPYEGHQPWQTAPAGDQHWSTAAAPQAPVADSWGQPEPAPAAAPDPDWFQRPPRPAQVEVAWNEQPAPATPATDQYGRPIPSAPQDWER